MIGKVKQDLPITLFLPAIVLLSITFFTYLNWFPESLIFNLIILLAVFNISGVYLSNLLKNELYLDFAEFIMLNLMVGSTISTFTYMYLSYLVPHVSRIQVLFVLTFLVLVQSIIFYLKHLSFSFFHTMRVHDLLKYETVLVVSGLFASALVLRRLPSELWIGNDPWETAIVCRNIVKLGFSPNEALEYYATLLTMSHPAFYYLVSLVSLLCEEEVDLIVRAGPLVFSAICGMFTYIAVKRMANPVAGFVAPLLLFLNPFFNFRFSMVLRENLSIIILLALFTLLHARRHADYEVLPGFLIVNGLLLALITITHPLTVIFLLGLMAVYFYLDYANNRLIYIKEVMLSTILCIMLIIPYLNPLYIPVKHFLIKNISSIGTIISISSGAIIVAALLFIYIKKIKKFVEIFDYKMVRRAYVLIVILLFSYVIFKPTILSNYIYEYISLSMFSKSVIVIGVLGFIFEPPSARNIIIDTMTVSVSLLVCVYLLGITVPLDRTAVYTSWALTYYASLYLSKIFEPLILKLVGDNQDPLDVNGLLKHSHQYILLLFLLSTIFYLEASALRPSFTEFSSADIESAKLFVSSLKEGDLVIPIKTNYILQYVNISREYVVTTLAERDWIRTICDVDSLDQLFVDVPPRFKDVKHLNFCFLFNDLFGSASQEPLIDFLEEYGDYRYYGSMIVYSISVPYDKDEMPLNRVKCIRVNDKSIIVEEKLRDLTISSLSNVVIDNSINNSSYILYLACEDIFGNKGIWCALSDDGVAWRLRKEPVILGDYSEPFVIVDNETYRLYCVDTALEELVSFSSWNGTYWYDKTVVATNHNEVYSYWRVSSPIVWIYDGIFNMIYEEIMITPQGPVMQLVQLTSENQSVWEVHNQPLELWVVDRNFWTVDLDRVIIDDVITTDEGIVFMVRALKNNFNNKTWVTGTLLMKPERPNQMYLQEIEMENSPTESSIVDSIQVLLQPNTGALSFIIFDKLDESIFVAYPSDIP